MNRYLVTAVIVTVFVAGIAILDWRDARRKICEPDNEDENLSASETPRHQSANDHLRDISRAIQRLERKYAPQSSQEKRSQNINKGLGILTFLVVTAYTIFSGFQWWEIRQSRLQTDRLNIAFVSVADNKMFSVVDKDRGAVVEWDISPEWENSGNTTAINLDIKVLCVPGSPGLTEQFDWKKAVASRKDIFANKMNTFLAPHAKHELGICPIPPAFFVLLENTPGMHLYIQGIATYEDVLTRAPHVTRYCVEETGIKGDPLSSNPGIVLTAPVSCPGKNNCTDEQCDEK
jgi:hypothetical protein